MSGDLNAAGAPMSGVRQSVTLKSGSVAQTREWGECIAAHTQAGDCVILSGDLGMGKTHFAQGFAAGLGVKAQVISPTFPLVLVYDDGRVPLYHFDLYRLAESAELDDIDFYGLVEGEGVSLIEWGERFAEATEEADVLLRIEPGAREDERILTLCGATARGEALVRAVLAEAGAGADAAAGAGVGAPGAGGECCE